MSGPYCKDCTYFRATIGGGGEHGECYDPSKIIYDRNGNRAQDAPYVHAMYTCCEWTDAAAESDANLPTAADVRGILKDNGNG